MTEQYEKCEEYLDGGQDMDVAEFLKWFAGNQKCAEEKDDDRRKELHERKNQTLKLDF